MEEGIFRTFEPKRANICRNKEPLKKKLRSLNNNERICRDPDGWVAKKTGLSGSSYFVELASKSLTIETRKDPNRKSSKKRGCFSAKNLGDRDGNFREAK